VYPGETVNDPVALIGFIHAQKQTLWDVRDCDQLTFWMAS